MLKDHQNNTVAGNSADHLSQQGVDTTMGKVREVEIDQRLRSRRANDQVLDWESLWKLLFPGDIDIPLGGEAFPIYYLLNYEL